MEKRELSVAGGQLVTPGDVVGVFEGGGRPSLEGEIGTLRETLRIVEEGLQSGEVEPLKAAALVARLCDSIVKAQAGQQKLAPQDVGFTWLRAHFDRMLRELGYGEKS